MSIKKVCDRCNKVKEDEEAFGHVEYVDGNDLNKSLEYDLCPECAKQFRMFINGGTVEEDHHKDSKPCAVVIHKLANGNYGIENVPDTDAKETKMHCFSCKAFDPYGHNVPENHGYCLANCEAVGLDTVACDNYIANDSKEEVHRHHRRRKDNDERRNLNNSVPIQDEPAEG